MKRLIERIRIPVFRGLMVAATGIVLSLAPRPVAADGFCNNAVMPCDPGDPTSACYVPPEPPALCEPRDCNKCTKSPCYTATGIYVNDAVDLELITAGKGLFLSRRYQTNHAIDGDLGYGWLSSLSAHLYYAVYLKA